MIKCLHCGFQFPDSEAHSPRECPQCGATSQQEFEPHLRYESGPVSVYFATLWKVLSHPLKFFRQMPVSGGLAIPLTFALVCHWLGEAFQFLWHILIGNTFQNLFNVLFQTAGDWVEIDSPEYTTQFIQVKDRIVNWMTGAGPILIDPFFTLASLLFHSLLIFAAARICITPSKSSQLGEISFESIVRILSFAMAPAIFAAIPLLGAPASTFLIFVFTVIGLKEVYRIKVPRAVLIALFPKLIFVGIILMGLLSFGYLLIKLVTSVL